MPLLVGGPDQVATARIGACRLRLGTSSREHHIGEHDRVSVERANQCGDVHCGEITKAGPYALGLNVQVWLSGIARVSDFGNRLAELDLITDLHLDAAWAEMPYQQVASATNVDDDVVSAWVLAVGRSDRHVWSAVQDSTRAAIARKLSPGPEYHPATATAAVRHSMRLRRVKTSRRSGRR